MTDEIIGKVVKGKVTNVAHFGAFIALETGEEGLVHISEIANEFITDINQFVKPGDEVKVKVLARNEKKKLELSIKQAEDKTPIKTVRPSDKKSEDGTAPKKTKSANFEDKMTSFMKKSEERQIDLRRIMKKKQGITKRKR